MVEAVVGRRIQQAAGGHQTGAVVLEVGNPDIRPEVDTRAGFVGSQLVVVVAPAVGRCFDTSKWHLLVLAHRCSEVAGTPCSVKNSF